MMLHRNRLRIFLLASALLGIAVVASPVVHAATVVVVNNDGLGEGFNDPSARAPVGGNTGTTLGQQRLIAFQRAADIWAARLASSVPIRVRAQFNPLACTDSSGTLGSAGPTLVFRDFSGAPVANTWYAVALANALRGSDLDAGDDINATFNSSVGTPGCLSSSGWYYGLDGNPPSNQFDFVTVLLHELGHGLGFLTFVDLASGAKLSGFNDTYMRNLENHGASPPDYPSMSNAQRVAASTSTGNLHWTGTNVRAASGVLSAGRVGDHVRMFAPNPQQSGSSVSHWDTVLTPNQLMEPNYTQALHDPALELPLFQDIGWSLLSSPVTFTCTFASRLGDFSGDARSDILWRNVSGALYLWLMNSVNVVGEGNVRAVPNDWHIVSLGAFDGSNSDILWRNNSGQLYLWLMNSVTVVGEGNVRMVPIDWHVIGTSDFNGDGRTDILWRHDTGSLYLWLMNSFSVVSEGGLGTVPNEWRVVSTSDFNGDNRSDILWRHDTGALYLWLMNSFGVVGEGNVRTVPNDWSIVSTSDFNGDGRSDILWRHTSGALYLWLMNGLTVVGEGGLGTVPNEWHVVGTADLNGDGRSDILWRHTTGAQYLWLMNGLGVLGEGDVRGVPSDWNIAGPPQDRLLNEADKKC